MYTPTEHELKHVKATVGGPLEFHVTHIFDRWVCSRRLALVCSPGCHANMTRAHHELGYPIDDKTHCIDKFLTVHIRSASVPNPKAIVGAPCLLRFYSQLDGTCPLHQARLAGPSQVPSQEGRTQTPEA